MQSWKMTYQELALSGLGNQTLMSMPKVAFFASRQCPGSAISAAMEWAVQQAKEKQVVISGFHSPLEQSILKILIAAHSPVIIVLARSVHGARLPSEWIEPLLQDRLIVVSAVTSAARLAENTAIERNHHAAQIADTLVVARPSPSGTLAKLCSQWMERQREIHFLN
jgi:predicted Rossmann fold nucleotide-binding protein DprA/Smf involved in DNA uptake